MEREGFFERVYDMVEQIPEGMVATYGQIARLVGEPRKARYVGFALHSNPRPGEVPCSPMEASAKGSHSAVLKLNEGFLRTRESPSKTRRMSI